ncbi:MAG: hypothetical protein ABII27_04015 [bacterium]
MKIRITLITFLLLCISGIAMGEAIHLISGGKINCSIVAQTDDCYLICEENKRYSIQKKEVIYVVNSAPANYQNSTNKKSFILPYIYPFGNSSLEFGICVGF